MKPFEVVIVRTVILKDVPTYVYDACKTLYDCGNRIAAIKLIRAYVQEHNQGEEFFTCGEINGRIQRNHMFDLKSAKDWIDDRFSN